MPEYLAPGVYVEELDVGVRPIEGVSTSTAGMVGVTERGPVNVPVLVTSFAEFQRIFGGYLDPRVDTGAWYLPHAVEGFFQNGGKRLFVTRVVADQTGNLATTAALRLTDRGERTGLTDTELALPARQGSAVLLAEDTTGLDDGDTLRLDGGSAAEYVELAASDAVVDPEDRLLALYAPLYDDHGAGTAVTEVTLTAGAATTLTAGAEAGATTVQVANRSAISAGTFLEIGTGTTREVVGVRSVPAEATDLSVTLSQALARDHGSGQTVTVVTEGSTGGTSDLSQPARAGDGLLVVDDDDASTTFAAGGVVRLGTGATDARREYHLLGEVHPVRLDLPASADHRAADPVTAVTLADAPHATPHSTNLNGAVTAGPGNDSITVDDASGLADDDALLLGVAGSGSEEYVVIDSIAGSILTLTADLARDHADGAAVVRLAHATHLDGAADSGDEEIAVDAAGSLAAGDVLRLGDAGTATAEYAVVDGVSTTQVTLRQALAFDHADGDSVVVMDRTAGTATSLVAGVAAGGELLILADATGFASGTLVEIGEEGGDDTEYRNLQTSTLQALVLASTSALAGNHDAGALLGRRDETLEVEALSAGGWGNQLEVIAGDEDEEPLLATTVEADGDTSGDVLLAAVTGLEVGTVLELPNGLAKVTGITGNAVSVAPAGADFTVAEDDSVETRDFKLTVRWVKKGTVVESETFRHLSLDPRHSRYVETVLGEIGATVPPGAYYPPGRSQLVRVRDLASSADAESWIRRGPEVLEETTSGGLTVAVGRFLTGGANPAAGIVDATYLGSDHVDPARRTGLHTLKNENRISLVAIPGRVSQRVQSALITHCERLRYRFAVLDSVPGSVPEEGATLNEVKNQRMSFDTRYAALYYPWVTLTDPFPTNPRVRGEVPIPPSGHVLGIYARTDVERGVHKAPANAVIRGIRGLQRKLNKAEHDLLNPSPVNVNVLRDFRDGGRGYRVWGARCITSDTDWKYVNVRRLFIFLEQSLEEGTQWVVFEPNDEPLWARVRQSVGNFLTRVWRDGALQGATPEEAFFVKCDRTTMTQDDLDNGKLIVLIGVAPVKPAEFVILRIFQWTLESQSQ
jgi:hypothetical protein